MRQKLSAGFTSGKLKGTHKQIQECSDQLLKDINKESCKKEANGIEVYEIVNNLTIDVRRHWNLRFWYEIGHH